MIPRDARSRALILALALAGAATSLGGAVWVHWRQQAALQEAFHERAHQTTQIVKLRLTGPLEVGRTIPSLFRASTHVSQEDFRHFVADSLARYPAIAALQWAPEVSGAERAEFEAKELPILEPGPAGGPLVPAEERERYYPIRYVEPLDTRVLGRDLAFETEGRAIVERAIRAGDLTITPRFRLPEDPPEAFVVAAYAPTYYGDTPPRTPAQRAAQFRGFGIQLIRFARGVDGCLAGLDLEGLGLRLLDRSAPPESQELCLIPLGRSGELLHDQEEFSFGDRTYALEFTAPGLALVDDRRAWTTLGGGLLLSLALSFALALWLRARGLKAQVAASLRLGQYTLGRKLAEGGMGSIYEAKHALLRRPTAVKLIRDGASGPEARVRFEREVQATSELQHPNSVAVYDFGRTPEGVFYCAMELIDGLALEEVVARDGPLPPERAVGLMIQACDALAEAHARGLVHRDVKPDNLMISVQGGLPDFVKVLDFGLVKEATQAGSQGITLAEGVGTPLYMSPEVLTDPGGLEAPADVYSCGATLYYLLCGEPVFNGKSALQVALAHAQDPPLPLGQRRAGIPPELEALVMRCLEKDPALRPADAGVLRAELEALRLPPWGRARAEAWWKTRGPILKAELRRAREVAFGAEESSAAAVEVELKERRGETLTVLAGKKHSGR